jgi:hypothetical protein
MLIFQFIDNFQLLRILCKSWKKRIEELLKSKVDTDQILWTSQNIIPSSISLLWERFGILKFLHTELNLKNTLIDKIEYAKFIQLSKYFPAKRPNLVPIKEVDEVWHQHILNTLAYKKFCEIFIGEFLHHIPGDGSNSQLQMETYDLYIRLFPNSRQLTSWYYTYCIPCCFEAKALIKMADGSKKCAADIRVGDLLMSGNGTAQKSSIYRKK